MQHTIHLFLLGEIIHYLSRQVGFPFLLLPSFFSESGPGAYESGIMVSKAVEIYIQGKLLKPAGKHIYCIHTHGQN